jgi:hypothetical protein
MPYVTQERRPALDKVVDELANQDLEAGDIQLFLLNIVYEYAPIQLYYHERRIKKAVKKAKEADVKPNGDINYVLFKYCKHHIKPSYNNYKAFMGEIYNAMECISTGSYKDEFRESAEWIRIKLLTPYEEKAIEKNGDT